MMKQETENAIRKKILFYHKERIIAHIKMRGIQWYNGLFIEEKSPGVWVIKETKLGLLHLFEEDIKHIEDYTKEKAREGKK